MNTTIPTLIKKGSNPPASDKTPDFVAATKKAWQCIAPFWPLKSLIAVNPLQGFENLQVEEALLKASAYFQQSSLPEPMEEVNRETMKWLQAYFDEGQATIAMPLKSAGLYAAYKQLAVYDTHLHKKQAKKIRWLTHLPALPEQALALSLNLLQVSKEEMHVFLTLLLTTMPGWASYIKYQSTWRQENQQNRSNIEMEYLALRATITYLLWPEAKTLLNWHEQALKKSQTQKSPLQQIEQMEKNYRPALLKMLKEQKQTTPFLPSAQLVFCIDVRSEPFRKALEATGNYETFGFAGFFGIPAKFTDMTTGESHTACPVLVSAKHEIKKTPFPATGKTCQSWKGYASLAAIKQLYQSVKYTFAAPFAAAESLGIASGTWIGLRTFSPRLANRLKKAITNLIDPPSPATPSLDAISIEEQCAYAENVLKVLGLTKRFAPLIVFCGHKSSSQNNAFASALDCGACGGNHGSDNAQTLAKILNQPRIKKHLAKQGIVIPETTRFIGATHNTTTDEVILHSQEPYDGLAELRKDLAKAQKTNSLLRLKKLKPTSAPSIPKHRIKQLSQDWAEIRPEWGLAKNAAFIVGPRSLTASMDLDGRCFLHCYDHTQDMKGKSLEAILTAPMVVAQWINAQYLFSTLDNVSFGSGSKITKNITGKIGVIQGNGSDLMTGLPLQSVYATDKEPYHEPQRLMTVVYAPIKRLETIIQAQPLLQKLFGNGWVQLVCLQPDSHTAYFLERDLSWKRMD